MSEIFVGPKVVDVQVNGGWVSLAGPHSGGSIVDFSSPNLTADEIVALANSYNERGVYLVPTIITADHQTVLRNSELIVNTIGNHDIFAGIHLEGPHLSPKCKGAHPQEHLRAPSFSTFIEIFRAAQGQIVLTTVAPELEGALDFIQKVASQGVVVAAGHHSATIEELKAGFTAGITALTHAGNAWESPNEFNFQKFSRKDTSVYDALSEKGIFVMVIPDGRHVSPRFLRMCNQITKSINPNSACQRFVITSDASPAEGAPIGSYQVFSNLNIEVRPDPLNGSLQTVPLSGSWLDLRKCMQVLARMSVNEEALMKPKEIQECASTNILEMLRQPFKRMGIYDRLANGVGPRA